jgi:hypothetical protein
MAMKEAQTVNGESYPLPKGYTRQINEKLWNVGFLFTWSPVYRLWVDERTTISFKPHESFAQAYRRNFEEPLPNGVFVFFAKDF